MNGISSQFKIIKNPEEFGYSASFGDVLLGVLRNEPGSRDTAFHFPIIDPITGKEVGGLYRIDVFLGLGFANPAKVILAPFQILYTKKHSAKLECHICGSQEDLQAMPSIAHTKKLEPKYEAHIPFEESAERYFCGHCRDAFGVSLEVPENDIFGNPVHYYGCGYYLLEEFLPLTAMANINNFITWITQVMIICQRSLPDDQKKKVLCPLLKLSSFDNKQLLVAICKIIGKGLKEFFDTEEIKKYLKGTQEEKLFKFARKNSKLYYILMMRLWEMQSFEGRDFYKRPGGDIRELYQDLCKFAEKFPKDLNLITLSFEKNNGAVYKNGLPPIHLKKEWIDKVEC